MSDFTIRADAVDVEQIMRQIRGRIRDKRGVDYTEEQIRELAAAKLERFLDPTGVRSDLLEQFRTRPSLPPGFLYQFEDTTLFDSDKAIVRFFRKLLHPFLKLLFNPNVLSTTLHKQATFNQYVHAHQPLQFELLHNLVLELTRASIEVKNLKMRLESVQSRLEFNERRARALEAVVQYKPDARVRGDRRDDSRRDQQPRGEHARGQGSQGRSSGPPLPQRPPQPPAQARAPHAPQGPQVTPQAAAAAIAVEEPATPGTEPQGGIDPITGGDSLRTRRRRRRRGRRGPGEAGGGDGEVRGNTDPDTVDDGGGDNPAPHSSTADSAAVGASPRTWNAAAPGLATDGTPNVQQGADSDVRLVTDATNDADAGSLAPQPPTTESAAVADSPRASGPAPAGSSEDPTRDVPSGADSEGRPNPDGTPDRDDERQ